MPLEETGEGLIRGTIRFFTYVIVDIVLDLLVRGPGYLVMKWVFRASPDPDSFRVLIVGLIFWVLIGIGGYSLSYHLSI